MNQVPALTQDQFDDEAQLEERPNCGKSREHDTRAPVEYDSESGGDEVDNILTPLECLFCNVKSFDVENNIEHMHSVHGLFIPEPDHLSDMETFLGYLASLICRYNECLYCGAEKNSLEAVQAHMKDKSHCMINLDSGSELLEFWDVSDEEGGDELKDAGQGTTNGNGIHVSATEMRLPSGSIITSRSDTAQLRAKPTLTRSRVRASIFRVQKDEMRVITNGSKKDDSITPDYNRSLRSHRSTDRYLAVRGETGLIGLSELQKRTLMAAEVKMKKREHIAKAAQRWAVEKIANKQKFFKVCDVLMRLWEEQLTVVQADVPGRKNG